MKSLESGFVAAILEGSTWEPVGDPHPTHPAAIEAAKTHYLETYGLDHEPQFFEYVSDDGREWNPHIIEVSRPECPLGPARIYKIVPVADKDAAGVGVQFHPKSDAISKLLSTHKPAWPASDPE